MDMYHPGYFGKVGMRYFHKTTQQFHCPILNLDKLWSFIPTEMKEKAIKDPKSNIPVIDTVKLVNNNSTFFLELGFCWLFPATLTSMSDYRI